VDRGRLELPTHGFSVPKKPSVRVLLNTRYQLYRDFYRF
jgi:hypothetical protein